VSVAEDSVVAPSGITFADRFDESVSGDGLSWQVGEDLLGAFGGLFGGLVAAMAARAARVTAPGRRIAGLDIIFERPLLPGTCSASAVARRAGRSLTVVDSTVVGHDGAVAARAVAMLVNTGALRSIDEHGPGAPVAPWVPYAEGTPATDSYPLFPRLVTTLGPRAVAHDDGWIASIVVVPWDVATDPHTVAEAVCFAGDLAVGPPIARHLGERWGPHPNTDLSVRICAGEAPPVVAGIARVVRVSAGIATTELEITGPEGVIGAGSSCSLLLEKT